MLPRASIFALLAACGEVALPPAADAPASVAAAVVDKQVGEGEPVVLTLRTRLAEGWTLGEVGLAVEGLEVDGQAPSAPRQVGAYTVAEQQLELTGPNGSYVIDVAPVVATGPGGETLELDPDPIFVDVGVQGPASTLSEFEAAPPPAETPWAWIAAAVAALLLLGGLGAWRWSRRGEGPTEVPPTPLEQARSDWAAARSAWTTGSIDDHALSVRLSAVFRAWLEATLGFPATARTTREILSYVEHHGLLVEDDRARARRLLDATDRLKFAREGGGAAFFEGLDGDFDAVLRAAQPERSPESTDA